MSQEGQDYIVAVVIATEVPPPGTSTLLDAEVAIRAVASVIRNRVVAGMFGKNAVDVVLAPKQFSAVCREAYWREAMAGHWFPQHVANCLTVWQRLEAPIHGARYYYSPVSMVPTGAVPSWVAGKTEVPVAGLDREFFRFYA